MNKTISRLSASWRAALFLLASSSLTSSFATEVWTGPTITYTKSTAAPADTIVEGKVVLKRGGRQWLFNTALGEKAANAGGPKGIVFAFGDISNFSTLSYKSLDKYRNGNLSGVLMNKPMVAHIIDGDIYFSITFNTWGHGSGTVSYVRSTPAAVVPPTVTLTSPAEGATFTAPADVSLSADANGGTITGVSFYNDTTLLGTVPTAPYTFAANGLPAGSYSFTAVATTAQTAATSGVVHITVTAPLTDITLSPPVVDNGSFSFTYTTDAGQTYIVQSASTVNSSGSFDWAPVATNTPSGSSATFSETIGANPLHFFRVGRVSSQ